MKRFALWVVLASLGYLTWWALRHAQLATLWSQPGKGGFPNFWQGVDLVIAMPASWLPLAADYTRFSSSRSASFWGTALGYLFANVWLFALGAILLLSRSLADAPSVHVGDRGGRRRRRARARSRSGRRDEGAVRERLLDRGLAPERAAARAAAAADPRRRGGRDAAARS